MDLFVRIKPKSGARRFYRCLLLFTPVWAMYAVDEATAKRLRREQMLEVSDTRPADYVDATEVGPAEPDIPPATEPKPADDPVANATGEVAPSPAPKPARKVKK